MNLEKYGNTSSASVPMTLDEANRAGWFKPGDVILMMAIGGGMAWGARVRPLVGTGRHGQAGIHLPRPGVAEGGHGQGALPTRFPEARAVFEAVDAALGEKLSTLCFEGPEEALKLTANTQPAILTVSAAAAAVLGRRAA